MTEFGSLALVDEESGKQLSLPGVRSGDMASRHFKPEVLVNCVQFSPTGRAWIAASTEGILMFSLDENVVFDPYELTVDVTPDNIRRTLKRKEFATSLMLALRLNEQQVLEEVIESIPLTDGEPPRHFGTREVL